MIRWKANGKWVGSESRPSVMAIVNVTPDSFSDGGQFGSLENLLARAEILVNEGADILDIGGESSRPGASRISIEEELSRVIPLIARLARRVDVPISVDTTKPEVAYQAIASGASIINDIGGLRDPKMIKVVAGADVGVAIMHMQGTPETMQDSPKYGDVVEEVHDFLKTQVMNSARTGIDLERIAIDPGIGFGKSYDHNLALLDQIPRFSAIGCPVLIGTSRKGFLGTITGRPVTTRIAGSIASALAACARGASIVRVHDVAATVDALRVWEAQNGWT